MLGSWKIGRVAGIALYLHPTFLLLLGFVALFQGGMLAVALVAAVFGCVVLHELGHALTARLFGIGTRDITLLPIGGVARLERMPRAPGAELLIALAGPAVNVVIAGALGLILALGGVIEPGSQASALGEFLHVLMQLNIVLAVFNLLPAFPMDGGRVVRALLSGWLGRVRATDAAATLGQVLAVAIPLWLLGQGIFNPMHLLLAAFVFMAAGAERAAVRAEAPVRRRPAAPIAHDARGIWFAPPGYRWVSRGAGCWQLVPIVVADPGRSAPLWR
jgi:Zn-dependent protease